MFNNTHRHTYWKVDVSLSFILIIFCIIIPWLLGFYKDKREVEGLLNQPCLNDGTCKVPALHCVENDEGIYRCIPYESIGKSE